MSLLSSLSLHLNNHFNNNNNINAAFPGVIPNPGTTISTYCTHQGALDRDLWSHSIGRHRNLFKMTPDQLEKLCTIKLHYAKAGQKHHHHPYILVGNPSRLILYHSDLAAE